LIWCQEKVLHVVTLTRVETGSSWKTEDACVRQALEECLDWGLKIVEVVHDDKSSVDSILTELEIDSQKDLWQKTKNIGVKFRDTIARVKKGVLAKAEDARTASELESMTVAMLKEYLKNENLSLSGRKANLVARV
jgi:hypothetical protein